MAGDRANLLAQPEEMAIIQVTHTNLTEIPNANCQGKAYFTPIAGHHREIIYGWDLTLSANGAAAWTTSKKTKMKLVAYSRHRQGPISHHDQVRVHAGHDWTGQPVRQDKVRLSYPLNSARDNLVVESLVDRLKRAGQARVLATDGLDELEPLVLERVAYDNRSRRHSRLDCRTPLAVLGQMRLYNSQNSVDLPVDSLDDLRSDHPP